MTRQLAIVSVAAALALAAQPVAAERGSRGGGRPGGHPGGRPGGGYAVPRGSAPGHRPGYAPGGVATARHPQPGRYYYGSPGHGRYPSYGYGRYYGRYPSYGYGRYHGRYPGYGYYYPGYGYYSPYYGSSFGLGLYFGFGGPYAYGGVSVGWPYGYGAYGWAPYASPSVTNVYVPPYDASSGDDYAGVQVRPDDVRRDTSVPNTGRVRLEVRPEDASVYVDDTFWGSATDARRMVLRAGPHSIELVRPGFTVERREIEVVPGESSDVFVELHRP
jgi:hypothetical protein